jgi:hypothetical protein
MHEIKNLELGARDMIYPNHLHNWEEALGPLKRVWMENDALNVIISDMVLILPPELEEKLQPLIGSKIAILRTG